MNNEPTKEPSKEAVEAAKERFTFKKPIYCGDEPDAHTVWLKVGVQSFRMDPHSETSEHAEWMREMLAKAILNAIDTALAELREERDHWKVVAEYHKGLSSTAFIYKLDTLRAENDQLKAHARDMAATLESLGFPERGLCTALSLYRRDYPREELAKAIGGVK